VSPWCSSTGGRLPSSRWAPPSSSSQAGWWRAGSGGRPTVSAAGWGARWPRTCPLRPPARIGRTSPRRAICAPSASMRRCAGGCGRTSTGSVTPPGRSTGIPSSAATVADGLLVTAQRRPGSVAAVAADTTLVAAYDAATGAPRRQVEGPRARGDLRLVAAGEQLLMAADRLTVLHGTTGAFAWCVEEPGTVVAVDAQQVILAAQDGRDSVLRSLDTATGAERWRVVTRRTTARCGRWGRGRLRRACGRRSVRAAGVRRRHRRAAVDRSRGPARRPRRRRRHPDGRRAVRGGARGRGARPALGGAAVGDAAAGERPDRAVAGRRRRARQRAGPHAARRRHRCGALDRRGGRARAGGSGARGSRRAAPRAAVPGGRRGRPRHGDDRVRGGHGRAVRFGDGGGGPPRTAVTVLAPG
jgi:hypothetical protein